MKKKHRIRNIMMIVAGAVAVILAFVIILFSNQIKTVSSITKVTDGFYQMTISHDYKLENILQANISTMDDFEDWISQNLFFGYPVSGKEAYFGCSSFLAQSQDSDYLMGRNFDYFSTDTLILYTKPENGYASYALADLDVLDIGKDNAISADSMLGKITMLAAPYMNTEGMNEMGLGVSILELETDEIHQDKGSLDQLLFVSVRMILDKCANVDEAIAMLSQYDIHTFFGDAYHLFIADASGKSVVVEWVDGEMKVVDAAYCTNFQLSEGTNYLYGIGQDRYEIIKNKLATTTGILSSEEAMSLLSEVKIESNSHDGWGTEWSCVFNLSDFTVDVSLDMDYKNVYKFSKDNFIKIEHR